jgi:chromosome segregation ATPase
MTRKYAEEWGRWRETIEHLKKTAAGQQKRADKLEQRLDDARQSILCVAEERDDARAQLRAASAELDHARREAAAWEVQCQDLRDRLTQPPDMTAVEATIEQWNAGTINRAELQAGLRAAFDRTPSSPGTLEIGSHCVVPSESTAIISANEIAAARKMS